MTIGQIKGFMKAIARRDVNNRVTFVIDTAVGSQSEGKNIKKTVQSLQKVAKNI
jgi:hypothetical protein